MHAAYDNREHTINSQNKNSTHTQYPAHPFFKLKISFNTSSMLNLELSYGNHGFISKTLIIDIVRVDFSTVDSFASTSCKEEALKIVINRCCMVVHYHSRFFMLAACMSHPPS